MRVDSTNRARFYRATEGPIALAAAVAAVLLPAMAQASLESSLDGMRSKLTGTILPVLSVIGIALAGVSFFTGNPQAKQHVFYAVLGAMIGFVDFIAQTVH